jgi:hypothetical protein
LWDWCRFGAQMARSARSRRKRGGGPPWHGLAGLACNSWDDDIPRRTHGWYGRCRPRGDRDGGQGSGASGIGHPAEDGRASHEVAGPPARTDLEAITCERRGGPRPNRVPTTTSMDHQRRRGWFWQKTLRGCPANEPRPKGGGNAHEVNKYMT